MDELNPLVTRFDAWRNIFDKKYFSVEIDSRATEIRIGRHTYPVVIDDAIPKNEMHVIDATGKKIIIKF